MHFILYIAYTFDTHQPLSAILARRGLTEGRARNVWRESSRQWQDLASALRVRQTPSLLQAALQLLTVCAARAIRAPPVAAALPMAIQVRLVYSLASLSRLFHITHYIHLILKRLLAKELTL